jgi:hypothetical protein
MGDEDVRHMFAPDWLLDADYASQLSANKEVEHDRHEHVDRRGPKTSRLEPPLGNGRYGLFIEAPASSERTIRIFDAHPSVVTMASSTTVP